MKIAIVMPVVLQNEILLAMTLDATAHLTTRHEATLYVIANRLLLCPPEILQHALAQRFGGTVRLLHENGAERTVAGAWNLGCQRARAEGADYVAIVANDARLSENCLDMLVDYGERGGADIWSGISSNQCGPIDRPQQNDGVDFTCFMIRPQSLDRHGLFDPNYCPAYFEDNDYYARVVLGGDECGVVHAAQFFHHGSITVRHDPELAHHMRFWFLRNRDYFRRKWGVARPENSRQGVLTRYYRHPFNDPAKPLDWFPNRSNPTDRPQPGD